jgi:hypothetical protein
MDNEEADYIIDKSLAVDLLDARGVSLVPL